LTKEKLIAQMDEAASKNIQASTFNFSPEYFGQCGRSHVRSEGRKTHSSFSATISIRWWRNAGEIRGHHGPGCPGVADLGVFQESASRKLLVSINRAASARYGLMASDVDTAVTSGDWVASLAKRRKFWKNDRRFDFVVRFQPQFRQNS